MEKFRPLEYKKEIDGLRAIAVLIVLFYHAGFSWFTGGFIGVDVFFIISGFLITHQIFDDLYFKKKFNFVDFYAKRFRRLFPLIYTVIIFVAIIWALFLTGLNEETSAIVKSIRYSIFGLANIYFERNTGGYFDLQSDYLPLLHFWSLAVEEQFYIVWPLLLFTTNKFFGAQNIKNTLLIIITSSFAFTLYLMYQGNQGAFYWMPARAWELGLGGLIVFILPSLRNVQFRASTLTILSTLGIAIILLCSFFYDHSTKFPGVAATLPVLATMLLIFSIFSNETNISRLLTNKYFVFIGSISYGIYLWHWPLFSFFKNITGNDKINLLARFVLIIASFALSYFSLKYIENPIRFSLILKKHPKKSILSFICFSIFIVLATKNLKNLDEITKRDIPQISLLEERNTLRSKCHNLVEKIGHNDCIIKQTENDESIYYVWGNSHADSFLPAVEEYAKEKGNISVVQLSASNYPAILNLDGTQIWKIGINGQEYHKKSFELISASSKPFSVFYVSRWFYFFKSAKEQQIIKPKIKEAIEKLQMAGAKKVYIVLPSIEFEKLPSKCILRKIDCSISKKEFENKRYEIVQFFKELQKEFSIVKLIDPLPYTCPTDSCKNVLDGIPVNYDQNHLTPAMAKKIPLRELID